jgi:hypothetical protein
VALPGDFSVAGVYPTMEQAERAVERLRQASFPVDRISIVGQGLESQTRVHGFVTTGDVAKSAAGTGAWVGGFFGLLSGAALLFIPGLGPLIVLGPLAAGAVGAAEGATGMGVLGGILGHFLAKRHIPKLTEEITAGKYLLAVHGTTEECERAKRILEDVGATDISQHAHAEAAARA